MPGVKSDMMMMMMMMLVVMIRRRRRRRMGRTQMQRYIDSLLAALVLITLRVQWQASNNNCKIICQLEIGKHHCGKNINQKEATHLVALLFHMEIRGCLCPTVF